MFNGWTIYGPESHFQNNVSFIFAIIAISQKDIEDPVHFLQDWQLTEIVPLFFFIGLAISFNPVLNGEAAAIKVNYLFDCQGDDALSLLAPPEECS